MGKCAYGKSLRTVVQTVRGRLGRYDLIYTMCCRKNCKTCYGETRAVDLPMGHGPYWYLTVQVRGVPRRLYIGKVLDTTKYMGPDGRVDWPAIVAAKKARSEARRLAAEAKRLGNVVKGVFPVGNVG